MSFSYLSVLAFFPLQSSFFDLFKTGAVLLPVVHYCLSQAPKLHVYIKGSLESYTTSHFPGACLGIRSFCGSLVICDWFKRVCVLGLFHGLCAEANTGGSALSTRFILLFSPPSR